jgi:hypothetical protein
VRLSFGFFIICRLSILNFLQNQQIHITQDFTNSDLQSLHSLKICVPGNSPFIRATYSGCVYHEGPKIGRNGIDRAVLLLPVGELPYCPLLNLYNYFAIKGQCWFVVFGNCYVSIQKDSDGSLTLL